MEKTMMNIVGFLVGCVFVFIFSPMIILMVLFDKIDNIGKNIKYIPEEIEKMEWKGWL